jgi:hypothetical protein
MASLLQEEYKNSRLVCTKLIGILEQNLYFVWTIQENNLSDIILNTPYFSTFGFL